MRNTSLKSGRLFKRTVLEIIELGRRFTECKRIVGHGQWLPWLERQFGPGSDRMVQVWMRVYEKSKSEIFSNLLKADLPVTAFGLLAAPSTPDEALDEILERAARGEQISVIEVKKTIQAERAKNSAPRPVTADAGDVGTWRPSRCP